MGRGRKGPETSSRPGIVARIGRILSREGPIGLLGRLRHSFLFQTSNPPPSLSGGATVSVHEAHDAGDLLARRLSPPSGGEVGQVEVPVIHIGAPPSSASPADLVFLSGSGPLPRSTRRAGLVVADDPGRIAALAVAGRQVIAAPSPLDEASLQRIEVMTGRRDPADFDMADAIRPALRRSVPRIVLTLPEFASRAEAFRASDRLDMVPVTGLRAFPSWAGAAYSYRQIARALLAAKRTHALIAQDDMAPGPAFEQRLAIAERHVLDCGADMLAGLVTDIDDSFQVRRVERRDGVMLVHLNRSVGLVMNLFGPRALARIAGWTRMPAGPDGPMTIDRYLGAAEDFEVVVPLPFLIGHRLDARSTIWSFANGRYATLIAYSEKRLNDLVVAHEARAL